MAAENWATHKGYNSHSPTDEDWHDTIGNDSGDPELDDPAFREELVDLLACYAMAPR